MIYSGRQTRFACMPVTGLFCGRLKKAALAGLVMAGLVFTGAGVTGLGMGLAARPAFASTHKAAKHTAHHKRKRHARKRAGYNPPQASIVLDARTGAVLSSYHADSRVRPASLTKLMTLLLTFERLENGTASLTQRIAISNHAAAQPPSHLGIPAGSSISLRNAIYAIVTKSANDIAVAVAENLGGSEDHFVYLMNEKAKKLGMNHTHFENASGLNRRTQTTTARDFAKLALYLVKTYPREYKYFSTPSFTYDGVVNRNHNHLMQHYDGMDGMKTGFTYQSGFNLAASAVRDNHRLIAVFFGGHTAKRRNARVAKLLDAGFAKLDTVRGRKVLVAGRKIEIPAPGTAARTYMPALAQVPDRKPGANPVRLASAAEDDVDDVDAAQIGALAGQGDFDPAIQRRFETGMMAITAIRETLDSNNTKTAPRHAETKTQPATPVRSAAMAEKTGWAVQLGAYTSRAQSDEKLSAAMDRLPATLQGAARPVIVPLRAGDGWVYRARLQGLSRLQAAQACHYFNDCMAISPRAF